MNSRVLDDVIKLISRNKDYVAPVNLAFTFDLPITLTWDLINVLMAVYAFWVFAWVKPKKLFWPFFKLVPLFLIWYIIFRVSGSVLHHRAFLRGYPFNNVVLFLANETVLCGVFFAVMVNKFSFRGRENCGIPASACTLILYFNFLIVKMILYGMYLFFLKNTGESPMNLINACYFIIFLYTLITYLSNGDEDLRLFLINLITLPLIQSLTKLRELCYFCTPDALADMAIFYIHTHTFWWESLKESVKKNPNPTTNIRLIRIFNPRLFFEPWYPLRYCLKLLRWFYIFEETAIFL